ncbi:hypothetical protein KUCAC02_026986 [Chaenocephalus aceratus]|nr:hypothetical protein KUCAC02_026986 [Chaenocephalus aceratus]
MYEAWVIINQRENYVLTANCTCMAGLPILETRLFVIYSLTVLTDDDIRELRDVDPGAAVLTSDTDTASSDPDAEEHPDLPEPLTALFDATLRELSPQEMNMKSSHQTFSDVTSLLSSAGGQCVFCQKNELANKDHLQIKHIREAVYFLENNQEKFVISCLCKDKKPAPPPGPSPPDLNSQEIVTTQATVYGIKYIQKGVSVAVKQCPTCANLVRFQDVSTGFHNFNNRVILTLPLCELLLSGLANKTTTGRMLDTLSLFNDNRYHHQIVRRAFHHFLSLTNFKFDFYCHQCGYNPAVVVADANWKLAFDIPLGTFKRPDPDTISESDLEVDIVKAWSELEKSLVAEGLISGTSVANPFCTSVCHSTLAPWMGEQTRVGNILPKTEAKKALKKKKDDIKHPNMNINEDIILGIIDSKKPKKKELQDACDALGVSSEGSISDLMNRLLELLHFKDIYPKLFVKLQKAGGGVLHFSCVHGIVYYMNILFWTESARDHTDGLLSFKRFPTCYISDVAGQVARHTNNRTKTASLPTKRWKTLCTNP